MSLSHSLIQNRGHSLRTLSTIVKSQNGASKFSREESGLNTYMLTNAKCKWWLSERRSVEIKSNPLLFSQRKQLVWHSAWTLPKDRLIMKSQNRRCSSINTDRTLKTEGEGGRGVFLSTSEPSSLVVHQWKSDLEEQLEVSPIVQPKWCFSILYFQVVWKSLMAVG